MLQLALQEDCGFFQNLGLAVCFAEKLLAQSKHM